MPHDAEGATAPLTIPPLGISTCRFHRMTHPTTLLERAHTAGIRLFATFPGLDDGFSESVLGDWSSSLQHPPTVLVFLGLLEGMMYHRALEREREAHPYPELVRLHEGVAYCLHPSFLHEQLQESRQRLGLIRPSGVLLQHPELFLQWAAQQGIPREEAQHELLRRLEQAFAFLEQACGQGILQAYGVQLEHPLGRISLPDLLELATAVGGTSHHFRLFATPFNLFEPDIATEPLVDGVTVLEYAAAYGIQVIVYRPLNARLNGRPVLLAEPPMEKPALVSVEHIRGQLREFVHAETQLLRLLTEQPLDGVHREMVRESLTLSLFLQDHWHEFASYEDWHTLERGYLTERFHSLQALLEPLLTTEALAHCWTAYRERFHQALTDIGRLYAARAYERARRLRAFLEECLQTRLPSVPFAQLALALLQRTVGVAGILLASTSAEHLELLSAAELPALPALERQHWLHLREARTVLQHGF